MPASVPLHSPRNVASQLRHKLLCRAASGLLLLAAVVLDVRTDGSHIAAAQEAPRTQASVGMPVRIDQLVLPGTVLEASPVTDKTLVVVRIDAVYPHGTAFRYDLVCYGLEPGDYDLREFLRRKDSSTIDDLPPIPLHIDSRLAAGQIEPHVLAFHQLPWLGGYRLLLGVAGVAWVAGLIWLLYPRRKKVAVTDAQAPPPVLTLADRLRPLVTAAMSGNVPPAQLSELERALVSYWRRRLGLETLSPVTALAQLRAHPEAGPLLTQLETWLHRPAGDQTVNVAELLRPYQSLAPDVLPGMPA